MDYIKSSIMPGVNITLGSCFSIIKSRVEYNVALVRERGYTILFFNEGEILFFPLALLPEDMGEDEVLELTVRRIKEDEQ